MGSKPISSSAASSASVESKASASTQRLQQGEASVSSCPDITPEMILSGVYEALSFSPDEESYEDFVCRVYRAMAREKSSSLDKKDNHS